MINVKKVFVAKIPLKINTPTAGKYLNNLYHNLEID